MKLTTFFLIPIFIGLLSCKTSKETFFYRSGHLKIEKLTDNTFIHISYLETKTFGKVACNGMIAIDDGEAIIFDTPVNDYDSKELIDWVENVLKCKVKAIVVTHFHVDCLGGLIEFHKRQIPSYANNKTIELARAVNIVLPQNGFDEYLELKIGGKKVINEYVGEGHTKDNIVSYVPHEKVLFGGCLIKEIGAGKGNLADANIEEWSNTVNNVKSKYSDAELIVPGHGKVGGLDLLDYTIQLFKEE